ncbi:unnamed protein product [Diatraea saccharalis]|uniref:Uncharacterized protein n=1 Tax=Diatraea saccharalis TaxID=40085 RepID=A0A9N9N3V7_9NEOP|nr:unnamed protein product [Diatraea saccharalis]
MRRPAGEMVGPQILLTPSLPTRQPSSCLLRLQQLYQSLQPGNATFRISNVKRVTNASDVVEFLGAIERLDRWSNKYVVLDSSTRLAKEALISHVRDVHLGRRNYHYFLSGLVMDDRWEKEVTEFGAINITGFRVLDFSRKVVRDFIDVWKKDSISAQAALMYDAVQVLIDAILRLIRKKPDLWRGSIRRNTTNNSRIIDCNPKGKITPYEHGDKISRMIKKTEVDGLTGSIRFNEEGHRRNFSLQIMEVTVEGDMVKIASWNEKRGLIPVSTKMSRLDVPGLYDRNKTYIISTIEEPPYMIRNSPDGTKNHYPYRGFCVDLAKMISEKLEIKYEFNMVKDGKYGNENPKIIGGWDGIVGELIRKEVDIAIAPLTITVERETVVDFTKPFLSFDIKPSSGTTKEATTIFSFLLPLSKEIWTNIVNEFSFWNSMWFSLGSFMQQGSDITPRSVSGRIVGIVWWFFALIVISSYTANLASYLTLSRISEPTPSFSKVATCPEDTNDGHITTPIPQDSIDEHGWFAFLMDKSSLKQNGKNKPCEMLITVSNSGVKDFANVHGTELTLSQVAGLFYVLIGGLALGLAVALLEFCQHGRAEAARANVPLRAALKAKARMASRTERKSLPQRSSSQRDHDRLGWNGGAFTGYYTPANQIAQEETAMHASFTQV